MLTGCRRLPFLLLDLSIITAMLFSCSDDWFWQFVNSSKGLSIIISPASAARLLGGGEGLSLLDEAAEKRENGFMLNNVMMTHDDDER